MIIKLEKSLLETTRQERVVICVPLAGAHPAGGAIRPVGVLRLYVPAPPADVSEDGHRKDQPEGKPSWEEIRVFRAEDAEMLAAGTWPDGGNGSFVAGDAELSPAAKWVTPTVLQHVAPDLDRIRGILTLLRSPQTRIIDEGEGFGEREDVIILSEAEAEAYCPPPLPLASLSLREKQEKLLQLARARGIEAELPTEEDAIENAIAFLEAH
jgi:hypothetical protein